MPLRPPANLELARATHKRFQDLLAKTSVSQQEFDESRLDLARIGENVVVEMDGLNRTVTGRVGEIVPSVDSATHSFTAKIDLPFLPGLRAGMFGRAAFAAGSEARIGSSAGTRR